MSRPRNKNQQQQQRRRRGGVDMWADAPALAVPDKIRPPADPAALTRSLGDPPLGRHSVPAGNAVAAVIERASMLASALAASADMLGSHHDEA